MAALTKHAGAGLVAVLYVVLSLAEGGFDPKVLAAVTVAVWWLVIVGLFVRVWPGSAPVAAIACGGSLAALGAFAGLSLFWADDPGRAFDEVVRVAAYLGLFVFAVLASRPGSAASWSGGLTVGLAVVAGLALMSRFEPGLLTDGAGDLGATIPSAAGRLAWPIGYWNGLAACMALAVVALVWTGDRGRGRIARAVAVGAAPLPILAIYLTQSMGGAVAAAVGIAVLLFAARERIALLASALAGALGGGLLVFLASRRDALVDAVPGADLRTQGDEMLALTLLVALALGVAWYLLDEPVARLRAERRRVSRPVLAGAAALVVIAGVVAADPADRWEDFKDPGTLGELPSAPLDGAAESPVVASAAGNGRYQWWSAALDGWRSDPFTGLGAGNWELFWNANNSLPVVTAEAHSLYFETLAELGPIGLLLLVAFFATAIYAGIGRRRSSRGEVAVWLGLLGAGLASAAGEWTWEIPAATMPVVLAAAMLTGPATLRPPWPRAIGAKAPEGTSRRAGFGLGVATMLAGFTCIWIAGVSLLTTIQLDESRAASDAGDLEAAAKNASYAAAIQPWSPEPRLRLAQVEELRGRLDEARDAAEEAIDRARGDWRTWVVLARVEARDGEQAAAERALARAQALSPVPLPVELPAPE